MRSRSRHSLYAAVAFCAAHLAAAQVPAFDLEEIKTIFSFGDSWTTTGYTPSEGIDDIDQRATTSGGPTWVQYLARNHTSAGSAYYDLASLGSTISTQVVYSNGATDFAGQTGEFIAYFNASTSTVQWDSTTSLFTIFFGNDDIYNCFANGRNFIEAQPKLLTAFDAQVSKLYEAGARNFLLLSLPSLDRSPLASSIAGGNTTIKAALEYWNARLEVYAMFLEAKYAGVRTKWFDARNWTAEILDNPSDHGYNDATTACEAYSSLAYNPNANDSSCSFSLSTYFWKDFWRPTWRVHEQMAAAIATLLSSPTPSLVLPSSAAASSLFPSCSALSSANFSALLPSSSASSSTVAMPSATSTIVATETSTVEAPGETGGAGGIRVGTNTSGARGSFGGGPSLAAVVAAAVAAGAASWLAAG
ncbi:hypothetical protein JCM6882_009402 [Rhodosporidiobolus microsporus]